MAFDPSRPYNDLPPLPPRVDIETRAVLKACIEARVALAELKQIASLITDIQRETDSAVMAMDTETKEVRIGTEVVNAAGISFQTIFKSINEVSTQVQEISSAIQQLAGSSQQVVAAAHDIDAISKETASQAQTVSAATEEQSASMEEIAASSQALAKLAEELQNAVRQFEI